MSPYVSRSRAVSLLQQMAVEAVLCHVTCPGRCTQAELEPSFMGRSQLYLGCKLL